MVLLLIPDGGPRLSGAAAAGECISRMSFGAYLFIGYARVMAMQHQKPARVEEISVEVKKLHAAAA